MAFQVEIVLFKPQSLLLFTVQGLQIGVLNVGATITQDDPKTKNERALSDRVSDGLDEIPSEPANVKDSVVADKELESEESSHGVNAECVLFLLGNLDFLLLCVELVKVILCH